MANDNRTTKQVDWETGYIDRVKYLHDVRTAMDTYQEYAFTSNSSSPAFDGGGGSFGYTGGGGGDAETYRDMDIRGTTTLTAQEINDFFERKAPSTSLFRGRGQDFLNAQKTSGLNAEYLIAHSCLESGWGTSKIFKDKWNFFGIAAYDSSPYASAYGWDGFEGGLTGGAVWIAEHYAAKGQSTVRTMRHNGGTHQYATDPEWDIKIAQIWAGLPHASSSPPVGGTTGTANVGTIPIAIITNGIVTPPTVKRSVNQKDLFNLVQTMSPNEFASLDTSKFSFPNGEHSNMFFPHFAQMMYLVHQKVAPLLGVDKIVVSSGLRTKIIDVEKKMNVTTISPHMAGIAVDIFVAGGGDKRFIIADGAWSLGIRGIGIGADHVHIDAGPEAHWQEHDETKVYYGPGQWEKKRK